MEQAKQIVAQNAIANNVPFTVLLGQHAVEFSLLGAGDLPGVAVLGFKEYGNHFSDRLLSLERQLKLFHTGCWIAKLTATEAANGVAEQVTEKQIFVGYMISNPYEIARLALDKEYKRKLSPAELEEKIYLIHDVVVAENFRNLGIHKQFHKIAVQEAKAQNFTKIYAVALTTSFRKPDKKYRFEDVCKARWHDQDSMVVCRDLSKEKDPIVVSEKLE